MNYTWAPPKIAYGDRASFIDGHRRLYCGVCMGVETRYDMAGEAYHVYAMRPDDCKRLRHIGGETITRLKTHNVKVTGAEPASSAERPC